MEYSKFFDCVLCQKPANYISYETLPEYVCKDCIDDFKKNRRDVDFITAQEWNENVCPWDKDKEHKPHVGCIDHPKYCYISESRYAEYILNNK